MAGLRLSLERPSRIRMSELSFTSCRTEASPHQATSSGERRQAACLMKLSPSSAAALGMLITSTSPIS